MGNNTSSYAVQKHTLDLGKRGKIQGVEYDGKVRRYAGVRYALPPTGNNRWRKPVPLPESFAYSDKDGNAFDATEFSPACCQANRELATGKIVPPEDDTETWTEDCLYVNIWTPVVTNPADDKKKRPVMVWMHGGWFQVGAACHEVDGDPTELISTGKLDAIFVAVSYRLNIFGFLSSKALLEESNGQAAGNFGLWDQRLAMEWVYENIAAFGGDTSNITLAGRSAGSYSVEAQILHDFRTPSHPLAGKLFHKAFMSSNAIPAQPKTVSEVEEQFDEVCQYFSIPLDASPEKKLSQLRGFSEKQLVQCLGHLKHHTFRPVTDDLFFHSDMIEFIAGGKFAAEFLKRRMKLLIGEVAHEETLYAQFNGPEEASYPSLLQQVSNYYAPATTEKVLSQYTLPKSDDLDTWKDAFGRVIADGQVRASTRYLLDCMHAHGVPVSDIWRYRVDYRLSFIDESVAPMSYGVSHAMDGPLWK